MPLLIQAKMLRVLEEQTFRRLGGVRDILVDVRVVAATNRKLTDAIEQGKYSPSLEAAFRIAAVFGVPLESVFHYSSDE